MFQIYKILVSIVAVFFVISGERTYSDVRSDNYGTVFINIVSSYGFPLELKDGEIILTPKCSKPESSMKFTNSVLKDIPYGEYKLDIWQRGYFSESTQIVVNQPESWFTVGLRLGSLGAAESTDIKGKLLPTDAGKEDRRWVKLVGLYSDSTFETSVEKSGSFSFKGINFGSYILLTMSGAKVCDTRRVNVSLPIPFSITVNLTSGPCIE